MKAASKVRFQNINGKLGWVMWIWTLIKILHKIGDIVVFLGDFKPIFNRIYKIFKSFSILKWSFISIGGTLLNKLNTPSFGRPES